MKKIPIAILLFVAIAICSLIGCNSAPDTQDLQLDVLPSSEEVTFTFAKDSSDGHATVTIPKGRSAKVLLLADPQLDATEKYRIVGSSNELCLKFLDKFLDATNPDLIIVAGDMSKTDSINNWSYFEKVAEVLESKRIPWSFTFGNHDCQNEYAKEDITTSDMFGQLTKENLIATVQETCEYCLVNSENCSDGYGNHVINIRNTDGKLMNTFVCLDCTYSGDSYSKVITEGQSSWYKDIIASISRAEGVAVIPSIVATHVALPEAFISWKESFTEDGVHNEHYYYGELLSGNYSKYATEDDFFNTLLEVGSTKAVFFGHHHDNDASTEYKGIRLTFIQHSGMAHDYRTTHSKEYSFLSWPADTVFDFTNIDTYGDKRGGVMVTIEQNSEYVFEPVYASEVIADYSEWAINYDECAEKIIAKRGADCVIRAK